MKSLITLAVRRPVTIALSVLTLIVFGFTSILSTPLELMPPIEVPMLIVVTQYPNASPEDVEGLVTQRIEDAAETITGVSGVTSTSSENMSMVMVQLEYGTDITAAQDDLRSNLDIYGAALPEDAGDPLIIELNVDSAPTITLSATQQGNVDLLTYVDEYVQPQLDRLEGVAQVEVSGGEEEYISVEIDEQLMSQYGLSVSSIGQVIGSSDFSLPAGSIPQGDIDLTLRGGISYDTVQSLNDIPITLKSGDIIHLSDVATIYQKGKDPTSLSRTNGVSDVTLSISKRDSASTFDVTSAVKDIVEDINAEDIGVHLAVLDDSSEMILDSVISVIQTMVLGIILAMVVLFIFFRDFKASLIVGTSIPISVLLTLIAMQFMNFSFNILSLGGLVIGIGMMVDNSIVVLESCFRLKAEGKSFKEAAIEGAHIVSMSISASTLTTVVVFLPMALIEGMSGQLFGQFCFTIVFSLLASLISAITIVPLTFYRLEPEEKADNKFSARLEKLENAYANFLPKTLTRKKTVVFVAVSLLVISIVIIPLIGMELIPAIDEATVKIDITARPGTNLETLNEMITPIETMVSEYSDVEEYAVTMSGNSGSVTAYLKDDRTNSTEDAINHFRELTSDINEYDIEVSQTSSTAGMMSTSSSIGIPLEGADYEALENAVDMVEEMMLANPYVISTSSTLTTGNPQAEIIVDPVKAGTNGLVPMQVMSEVYTAMQGSNAATLTNQGRDYSIIVEYPDNRFNSITDLNSLHIMSPAGTQVPLLDIASIEYSNAPQSISRSDGNYTITVNATASVDAPVNLNRDLQTATEELDLPEGVSVGVNMNIEQMNTEFMSILSAIFTATFLVFIIMAMQFESPRFSIVVMLCIPFSLIGSLGLLLITGATISMPSMMGFLMLVGIVVNNGIIFIDTTNRLREDGMTPEDALAAAGKLRMRPILMTTMTTVLAMIPMGMGIGDAGAMMQGMAFVVIGGLIASTVLALLLLPTFYLLLDKKPGSNRRFFMKKGKVEEE